MCGGHYDFEIGKDYEIRIAPMSFSGETDEFSELYKFTAGEVNDI